MFFMSLRFLVFFFQAEDGIRDDLVTGVQTCALPILRGNLPSCQIPPYARSETVSRLLAFASARSEERREGKSVDLGGRRIIKKKKTGREKNDDTEQRDDNSNTKP